MINGVAYAWENLSCGFLDNPSVEFTNLQYEAFREGTNVYRRGSRPKGRTRGNIGAEASLTVPKPEFVKMNRAAKAQGYKDVRFLPPSDFTAAYALEDGSEQTIDILRDVQVTRWRHTAGQNDDDLQVELTLLVSDVDVDV